MDERKPTITVRACEFWPDDEGLHVRLRVANEGERTLFVGRGVRQLELDPTAGQLTVWLSDHGRDVDLRRGRCGSQSIPSTVALGPGDEADIVAVLPPVVYRMRPEGDEVAIDEHRTADFSRVTVNTAVAEAPFYYSPKGESIVRQLKAWGQPLRVEAERIEPAQPRVR